MKKGADPQHIIDGLIAAMDIVGDRFACGDLFIPEMMLSAKTMEASISAVRPLMVGHAVKPRGTVVVGTVEGDVHDIGKNLVIMMMQGAGFEIHDLAPMYRPKHFLKKCPR